jgi:chemotaxis protein CheD
MKIRVGMGAVIVTEPDNSLITTVGSCIAVCIYDSQRKIAGMAHVVLPKKREFLKQEATCKFADVAVPTLVSNLLAKGAKKTNLKAKITGGANMFPTLNQTILNIGLDNIQAVRQSLKEEGIPLIAEDVGGEKGRKLEFEVSTNNLVVQRLSGETKIL